MQAFGLTDIGKIRQLNQDYIFVSKESIGNPQRTVPNRQMGENVDSRKEQSY